MPHLIVLAGHDTGRRMPISEHDPLIIGRGSECSFQLRDPSVSRRHCRVLTESNRLALHDEGSRWGVQVNGRMVREALLRHGDLILIGDTEILVDLREADDSVTRAPRRIEASETRDPQLARAPQQRSRHPSHLARVKSERDVIRLLGERFHRFDVISQIAAARTGAIFRAWDNKHQRTVALKIFWPHLFDGETEIRRFVRAMRTAIPVRHENLVRVYKAGRARGVCYLASEVVEGASAARLIQRIGVCGMLDWRRVLRIAIQLADALQAAALHNMVHRNITPHNILIRDCDDAVKLNDLVFAKAIAGMRVEQITNAGEMIGELSLLSPEQTGVDHPIDFRADIYSLGATLYVLLTGRPPAGWTKRGRDDSTDSARRTGTSHYVPPIDFAIVRR